MTLPGNLARITVTGFITDASGAPAAGSVTFTLSSDLNDPTAKQIILATPVKATLVGGSFSVALNASDDPDLTPGNNYYTCDLAITGQAKRSYLFQLPSTTVSPVDLSEVLQIVGDTPTPDYLLMRVSSLTDVDLTGIADGDILVWDATAAKFTTEAAPTGTGGTDTSGLQAEVDTVQNTVEDSIRQPGAVEDLAVTPGSGSLTVTWAAPAVTGGASVTQYLVQQRAGTTGTWTQTTTTTGQSATISGLTAGTTVQVRVAALNVAGYSMWAIGQGVPT